MLVRLDAGSLGAWLLFSLAVVVLSSVLIPAGAIAFYRVVQPVLCTARWIGPTRLDPPGAFQREVEFIKLQAEMKSAKTLIVRIGLGLLCVCVGLATYVLLMPSPRGVLLLVVAVLIGLTAVWYAALLVVKLRAQRSAR